MTITTTPPDPRHALDALRQPQKNKHKGQSAATHVGVHHLCPVGQLVALKPQALHDRRVKGRGLEDGDRLGPGGRVLVDLVSNWVSQAEGVPGCLFGAAGGAGFRGGGGRGGALRGWPKAPPSPTARALPANLQLPTPLAHDGPNQSPTPHPQTRSHQTPGLQPPGRPGQPTRPANPLSRPPHPQKNPPGNQHPGRR